MVYRPSSFRSSVRLPAEVNLTDNARRAIRPSSGRDRPVRLSNGDYTDKWILPGAERLSCGTAGSNIRKRKFWVSLRFLARV